MGETWKDSDEGPDKSQKQKTEVIDEARTTGAKVHFASLMDICHLKNAELEAKHQKYKGRVVLPGDIVKDDSGSYAVFTEQGSSASQMTAAKVMDIISRLPGCAGQAADAVSAYTQLKMEDAHKFLKIPKSECPDFWIRVPRHKWPKSWSSMEDPVVPLERNLYGHPLAGLYGKGNLRKSCWNTFGRRFSNWECLYVHREKRLFLSVYVDGHQIGWKETKHWSDVETTQQRSRFGRTNNFYLEHSKTVWNKQRYYRQLPNHVWIQNFRRSNWWITMLGKSAYLFAVLRHGGSCQEMCGTIFWVRKQDDSTTLQSIYSMHWWPSFQRTRFEIYRRIVESIISNCSEMLVFGTYWKTWYSMVSKQTYTIDHKMDQSLWQTMISFDLSPSSHMWIQTVLPCGRHCQTMQIGTVSRLRFCGRSWGFKIYFKWNIVHFWKSYICSNQLDV